LDNTVVWSWSGGSIGPAQARVTIVEPNIEIIKTSNVNTISNGSEVVFTLSISHTSASTTDAYDVVVIDTLPPGLDYVANTLVCTNGAQDPDAGCEYDTGTRTIRAEWTLFTRVGGSGQITFRVVGTSALPGGSVTNVANVEWTSMPGDQTTPTSFSDPANQFATERYYDPADLINLYGNSDSLALRTPGGVSATTGSFLIPVTGFSPNVITDMSQSPFVAYADTSIDLVIPSLSLDIPIVGVPKTDYTWNVAWLGNQAGWLEGSAFPSWKGNSVLTGHVYLSNGKPGPFAKINELKIGDQVVVSAFGQKYIFEVQTNAIVSPTDRSVMRHEERPWLTLVTCTDYDPKTGTYKSRFVVRAVLVKISSDN
jgi:LPXTG-site transpeptidase (sortase) family protein